MENILFFFTASFPYGNGETFIENEINYLAAKFDRVVIVTNNCTDAECRSVPANCSIERMSYELNKYQKGSAILGIFSKLFWNELTIIRKHYKLPLSVIIIKTMLLTLKKSKVFQKEIKKITSKYSQLLDSVYYYSYWANDTAFAIAQIAAKPNCKKKISRAHGWDVYFEVNDAGYLPFRKYILEHLDSLFVISNVGQHYYQNLFPSLESKICVARLGVAGQTQLPVKQETFRIVSCSNVVAIKRINLIVDALSYVHTAIEWVHFGDGLLMNEIKNQCKSKLSAVPTKFTFKGNQVNSQVLEFYRQNYVDCFINVSSSEGIPVSIMEAMSFGIPVIATAVGGTPEIVKHAHNGFLLSASPDPSEIATTIEQFYSLSDNERFAMRQNAYNTWNEHFNASKNYTLFCNELIV